MINISGLDPKAVIMALYDSARPQGMGYLHFEPGPLPGGEAEAATLVGRGLDYLHGRVMKVTIDPDCNQFEERLYDRDNGQGAAHAAIQQLRKGGGL